MNLNRIICLVKGHHFEFGIYVMGYTVTAECLRCGHRLTQKEAIEILMNSSLSFDDALDTDAWEKEQ